MEHFVVHACITCPLMGGVPSLEFTYEVFTSGPCQDVPFTEFNVIIRHPKRLLILTEPWQIAWLKVVIELGKVRNRTMHVNGILTEFKAL